MKLIRILVLLTLLVGGLVAPATVASADPGGDGASPAACPGGSLPSMPDDPGGG